jgi:hypothetical protein
MDFDADGLQGVFQTRDPIPTTTRFAFDVNPLAPSAANDSYLANAERPEHDFNTLVIPNIFAAISAVLILVQFLYRQVVRSTGAIDAGAVTAVLGSPGGYAHENDSRAEAYSWKDGEARIFAWNAVRCVGCVLLFGISVWQILHGE